MKLRESDGSVWPVGVWVLYTSTRVRRGYEGSREGLGRVSARSAGTEEILNCFQTWNYCSQRYQENSNYEYSVYQIPPLLLLVMVRDSRSEERLGRAVLAAGAGEAKEIRSCKSERKLQASDLPVRIAKRNGEGERRGGTCAV